MFCSIESGTFFFKICSSCCFEVVKRLESLCFIFQSQTMVLFCHDSPFFIHECQWTLHCCQHVAFNLLVDVLVSCCFNQAPQGINILYCVEIFVAFHTLMNTTCLTFHNLFLFFMFFAHEWSEHLGSFAVGVIGKCAPCAMLKQCLYAPALVQRAASFNGAHLGCFLGFGSLVPLLTKNSDD